MRISITRAVGDDERPTHPSTWSYWGTDKRNVVMCCPQCIQGMAIQFHSIEENGDVEPAVRHACGWCETINLQGWDGGLRISLGEANKVR